MIARIHFDGLPCILPKRGVADVAAADEAQVRGVRQATQDVGNLVRFDGISLKNCDGGAERGARSPVRLRRFTLCAVGATAASRP